MSDRLPIVVSDQNELDALCRAWLGFDSASVERLQQQVAAADTFHAALLAYLNDPNEATQAALYAALEAYEAAVSGSGEANQ